MQMKWTLICAFLVVFVVSDFVAADDGYEDNDTFAAAREISYGSYSLTAADKDDDWFFISVNQPGMLYLELEHAIGAGYCNLNVVLWNSDGYAIAANVNNDQATEEFQYQVVVPGDYYISVGQVNKLNISPYTPNPYTLTVAGALSFDGDDQNDAGAGNDTSANATLLSSANTDILNQKAYDADWFKIPVYPGVLTVDLNFDSTQGDIFLEIYSENFQRLNHSSTADGLSSSGRLLETEFQAPGYGYIAAIGQNGNSYSLNLDLPTIWMTTLDYGPITTVSVALFDIDGDGEDEIFVGTSKKMDSNYNEIRRAGFVCLEDDGTVKWDVQFPAISGTDSDTGKSYNSTSVSTAPAFGDIDGDGSYDIVVGVGADTSSSGLGIANLVGQPGDKGGVYALEADGSIKWYHETEDVIGGPSNTGDGRPDGVYGSPVIFDLDNDGDKEVIVGALDRYVYVLDGTSGEPIPLPAPLEGVFDDDYTAPTTWKIDVLDTIGSTARIADINGDTYPDILIGADITSNDDSLFETGGIFHIFDKSGNQEIAGFDSIIGDPGFFHSYSLKGKWEEEVLWSSPVVGDLDGDGRLEIAYGTGDFFQGDSRGHYIRVWNHDGTEKFKLATLGKTFATPLFCDLENDGDLEIIATTLDGYVYGWDHNGTQLFATATLHYGTATPAPIKNSPLAIDINNDGTLEIIYAQGTEVIIVDYQGNQLTDPSVREFVFESFYGSPAVKDIDNDGQLDIICGGTTQSLDQAAVYRWRHGNYSDSQSARYARRQFHEATTEVENFVKRFYVKVLNRSAEPAGLNYWIDKLTSGLGAGAEVASGFINSQEFINRALDDSDYLDVLYAAFFDRSPDEGGKTGWLSQLAGGTSRNEVLAGFIYSQEFTNLCNRYGILPFMPQNQNVTRIEAFVTRFYQQCLEREPDTAGLQGWSYDLINQTKSGANVAYGFVFSQEFLNRNVDNETYLKILYRAFFDREPDDAGFNGWYDLLQQEASRESVLNGFLGAQEFFNLCDRYGIIPS